MVLAIFAQMITNIFIFSNLPQITNQNQKSMFVAKLSAALMRIVQGKVRSMRRMVMLIVAVVIIGFIYTGKDQEFRRENIIDVLRKVNPNVHFVEHNPSNFTWNIRENNIKALYEKANLDVWKGMCSLSFNSLRQHPFFPSKPHERSYLKVEDKLTVMNDGKFIALRIMGYLHPPTSGYYTFYLRSYLAAQLWLSKGSPDKAERIAYSTRNSLSNSVFFLGTPKSLSERIYLEYVTKYYFEVVKIVNDPKVRETAFNLEWMLPNTTFFSNINGKYVSNYFDILVPMNKLLDENLSASLHFSHEEDEIMGRQFAVPRFNTSRYHDDWFKKQMKSQVGIHAGSDSPFNRHNVSGLPYMERSVVTTAFAKCSYHPGHIRVKVYPRYQALWNTYFPEVFPIDGTANVRWSDNETDHIYRYIPHTYIDEKEVVTVV